MTVLSVGAPRITSLSLPKGLGDGSLSYGPGIRFGHAFYLSLGQGNAAMQRMKLRPWSVPTVVVPHR